MGFTWIIVSRHQSLAVFWTDVRNRYCVYSSSSGWEDSHYI